jgi:hypothetical protein
MGTLGLSGRVGFGRRRADRAWDDSLVRWRLNLIVALAILPIVVGCSSSPPWSSSANPPANQTAAVPPPPNYPATGQPVYTPPPAQQDYSDSLPYPKQSLVDLFRGSTQTQTQTVPQAPSTYTPSGQPYSPPPGQPTNSAPPPVATAAAPPPAQQDYSDSLPYPKQSLYEIFFSNKQ